MSEEYERYKKWWQTYIHRPVIDETKYKQIDGKEIENVFMDESNAFSEIVNKIQEQQRLLHIKAIIQDILKAYKGEITWNEYLKERKTCNDEIRTQNNRMILDIKENNYNIIYRMELPVLDFETFMIAEELGKLEREGK